jgi:hypothetical protein
LSALISHRAGTKLSAKKKHVLDRAKDELRRAFGHEVEHK